MKATLTFSLPDEEERLEAALQGEHLVFAIQHFFHDILRSRLKYGLKPGEAGLSHEGLLGIVREEMWQELKDRGLEGLIWK